jgi:hypothetical protein
MATTKDLMGLGMAAELALRLGYQQVSVTASGTTQNSAGGLLKGVGNKIVLATVTSGQAITLPSAAAIGDEIIVDNISAAAGIIFPPTGGFINGNAVNAEVNMAADGTATSKWRFVKTTATRWAAWEDGDV